MYLVLFRKPHSVISFAEGIPPNAFETGEDHYERLDRPLMTAAWRVDTQGYPVAVFCRLAPGEQWPLDIEDLPRLTWEEGALAFWLTTERGFERRDILCDQVVLYQAGRANYAFAFSLEGVSQPNNVRRILWPKPRL